MYIFETWIDNAPIEITASIVVPYFAYLGAEAIHASGVLSVVACGLYLGWRSSVYLSSIARIQARATWNTFTFILNGIAFLLIGLQLRYVIIGIRSVSAEALVFRATIVVVVVIALRLAWVYPGAYLSSRYAKILRPTPASHVGSRHFYHSVGPVCAASFHLRPRFRCRTVLANGKPFPQRNMIIFLTFCVIFVTLVLQGLTLPSPDSAFGIGPGKPKQILRRKRHAVR